MARTNVVKFNWLALMICIALGAPILSMAALTCCQVKPTLEACKCFARNGGDSVPQDCCYEAMNLKNNIISSGKDTIAACHCIQEAASKIPDINATAFSIIPQSCGIRLPFNFRLGMNCDSL
ncbi:non-specific lipid-transfer protein 1-like [Cicer arietinum]|uniref:Non-specific lipid-transfer protein 1-like n=1 Tax=Cicer arietinum TaxID=3827 RepID=A0A1S2XPN1_CICAR|nr:non-specific lipid-transfer protein 1-like [Cicer arietinum]